MKAISIGKAFKDAVNCYVYTTQTYNPLSNIELVRISDREAGSKIFLEVFKEFEIARDLLLNLNIKHFVKKAVDIPRNYPRI